MFDSILTIDSFHYIRHCCSHESNHSVCRTLAFLFVQMLIDVDTLYYFSLCYQPVIHFHSKPRCNLALAPSRRFPHARLVFILRNVPATLSAVSSPVRYHNYPIIRDFCLETCSFKLDLLVCQLRALSGISRLVRTDDLCVH